MSKHTPTPEEFAQIEVGNHPEFVGWPINSGPGFGVWWIPRGLSDCLGKLDTPAVAAKIVLACRAHDDLMAACNFAMQTIMRRLKPSLGDETPPTLETAHDRLAAALAKSEIPPQSP